MPSDQPDLRYDAYVATRLRAPAGARRKLALRAEDDIRHGLTGAAVADLTRQHAGEPIGERILVTGRVLDADGRPAAGRLIEIWQANSAGRYAHEKDDHPAPLDPNFTGAGRLVTGADGAFRFVTIKPGPYPWRNHHNAWRPAHIHFSVLGESLAERLITQMYFPGDPLFDRDPILQSVRSDTARERLISRLDWEVAEPEWALAYRFDIVLRGPERTPSEGADGFTA